LGFLGEEVSEPPAQFLRIDDLVETLLNAVHYSVVEKPGRDTEAGADAGRDETYPLQT
jgi:hypothetical protein